MKVRVKWPNATCSLHLKVGVERPKFSPHDFAGELMQTTTDPFSRPHKTKTGKKRSGNARLLSLDYLFQLAILAVSGPECSTALMRAMGCKNELQVS